MNSTIIFLKNLQKFIISIEGTLIDLISLVVPYLAPLTPAYLTYRHLTQMLDFPAWVGLASAGTIELLGLASVSTSLTYWQANKGITSGSKKQMILAVATTFFYLMAVQILAVGLMDNSPIMHRLAVFMLASLSIVGAIIIGLRASYAKKVSELEDDKQIRKAERLIRKQAETSEHLAESYSDVAQIPLKGDWRLLSDDERVKIGEMATFDVMRTYQISDRAARGWKQRVKGNGYHEN